MKTILLLHGALGSSEDLRSLAITLEKEGLKVLIFNFSGHGKSDFREVFSIPQFAKEVESFISEKELKNISVFGYSMGGFVALYLASKHPNLFEKIITLGTKFDWSQASVDKETKMLDPKVIAEKVPAFAKSLDAKHGEAWTTLLPKTAALMREINEKDFLSHEVIKSVSVPTLLGLGDRDQMVSLEETLKVYKTLPNAQMYMLPKTKHQLESANLKLLTNTILEFVTYD
ncbi:alpha/beta hydrolase [Sphingobacteriaceae bacterium]|nr:alpha/beta hydrolase [Sphingobacteriaceae bacterium]